LTNSIFDTMPLRLKRFGVPPVILLGTALVGAAVLVLILMLRPLAKVRTLEGVLSWLSRGNNLGTQPIHFMVVPGTYTAQLAAGRGFCTPDQCVMVTQLNLYQHHGNSWDELIPRARPLAISSPGEAPAVRWSFLGPWSAVAHEIAHIRPNHVFHQSHHLFLPLARSE
jgi:hypothetical protein